MGKGLVWNGVSATPTPLFLDGSSCLLRSYRYVACALPAVPIQLRDPDYEAIGRTVFRFEYYYLLSSSPSVGTANQLSAGPWSSTDTFSVKDVAAIVVAIAVIEPKSKVLLSNDQIATLAGTSPL